MKKKILSLCLALALLVSLMPAVTPTANAAEVASGTCGAQGNNLTWTLDEEGLLEISGSGSMANYSYSQNSPWYTYCVDIKEITIVNSVTSIGRHAFEDCFSLESITIGDSVKTIGDSAFDSCYSLESVIIPDSVKTIGNSAFYSCDSLESVIIPDSITSIGNYAFSCCTNLESIAIPDSVTSIGDYVFKSCTSLKSVTIGGSVTSIGDYAFEWCTNLESVTIGVSITSIGNYAFSCCTNLKSITIPDSVRSIGNYAFNSCDSLESVTIPDSVTSIGKFAFYSCNSLKSVTIPDSVTSIRVSAFNSCTNLESVTIPDSVTSIGDYAFTYCANLKSVTIPDSVTSIGESAFYICSNLTNVYYEGTQEDWNAITIDSGNDALLNAQLHCHTHEYENVITDPTCTEPGFTTYTCDCGDTYTADEVDALGHDEITHDAKAPTCTEIGWNAYVTCTRCDYSTYAEISATGHDHKSVVTEPTCTDPGYTTYTCGCGDSYVADETPAAGHDWDEGTVTTKPTAAKPGVMTFTCQRSGCDKTRTEDIPALGYTNPFTDVAETAYYYTPVLWAVANNITAGTSATTFSPNATCTRAQVVSFLYRAVGSPAPQSTDCPFTDVNPDGYYYNAMLWAVENGITAGTSATTFSPNKACTRGQVVSFLYRAAGSPAPQSTDCPFTDVNSGSYYYNAMLWAVENGITAGTSATTFSPDKPCTRGQVVSFLYRYDGVE